MVDVKGPAKEWRLFRVNFNNDVSLFPNKKKKKMKNFQKEFLFLLFGFSLVFLVSLHCDTRVIDDRLINRQQ